ncbi:hypothetical protein EF294_07435 [Gordonia oryzae]|uniref:Uncharacterized protein n=1 Tax=Gordonia oryzae TaxID=2487349 RepID=A0A3N4GTY2_9ACTN|nr:hypothetical protein [Gordonia oryzae]RPA64907.1 hypothetical protein EF294_07435 [Gordonia oryzae]
MSDDLYLSRNEIQQLSTQLRALRSWVCRDLDDAVCRQVEHGGQSEVKPTSDEQPLTFNEHASSIATHLHDTLARWVDLICTQRERPWPGNLTTSQYATWLDRHLVDLAVMPEAGRADREITEALRRALRAIDRPRDSEFIGPCQSPSKTVRCDGLYVRPGATTLACSLCGMRSDVEKVREQTNRAVADRLYLSHELSSALSIITGTKVPFERVRNWVRRNKLSVVSSTADGDLYRLSDALELLQRSQERQRGKAS